MGCKNVSDSKERNDPEQKQQQNSARMPGYQENKAVIDNVNIDKSRGGNIRSRKREVITTREIVTKHPDGKIEKKIITETHYIEDGEDDTNFINPVQNKLINTYKQAENNTKLDLNELRKEALQVHNDYRKKHKAPQLKLNSELNEIAQRYAEELAKRDVFEHSDNKWKGENIGENLYMCNGCLITGKDMTKSWYDEIKDYNFRKATFSSNTGHFTQVVWVGSLQVGFGAAKSKSGNYYGVANYYPAGNYVGEFASNVLPG